MSKKNKTVFAAMSGGVDSSVAAALMKKAGFSVVGVFMKPWSPTTVSSDCLWKEDREDALRVAAKLDIPFLTWDLSKEYEKHVARYMIEGYKKGITPNPDVMCNKFIKFGVFLEKALKLGADYIATGHYVRLNTASESARRTTPARLDYKLLKAKDLNKDQSYFLYNLTQEQLKYCLFPIGDWTKNEVRKMAKKFGLLNWDKKDSQGVCFVGPLRVVEFLKKYIKPKRGLVLRRNNGKILGEHDGVWFYTIGQRHGFNLAVGEPHYVVGKDIRKNILYVDRGPSMRSIGTSTSKFKSQNYDSKLKITEFNLINGHKKLPLNCKVKTRYRQRDLNCTILENGSDKALIEIKEKNIPIAPGQAAVFYKGEEMLGGGIIS